MHKINLPIFRGSYSVKSITESKEGSISSAENDPVSPQPQPVTEDKICIFTNIEVPTEPEQPELVKQEKPSKKSFGNKTILRLLTKKKR